ARRKPDVCAVRTSGLRLDARRGGDTPTVHHLPDDLMNPFDAASPFDARYYFADQGFFGRLHPYVSEVAQVRYLARVEAALAQTLADDLGLYPSAVAAEIAQACGEIKPEEVYAEEARIQHNIRALVNCIRARVGESARPFVHLFATSA